MAERIKIENNYKTKRIEREGDNKKPTRFYSHRQEQAVAKSFDGKLTKNSGATMFDKGDVTLDNFLIECKTKTSASKSIAIQKEWLVKNKQEALFVGKPYSALAFNFGPDEENYYIIDKELFEYLIGKIENE